MALRFQTRLSLAMSGLIAITIVVMALFVLFVAVRGIFEQFHATGVRVTLLATENVQYGITVPERVMDRVGDQMVVTALMLSELVDLAEAQGPLDAGAVSDRLRRVAERSRRLHGYPLVDEFWVADATGRITIGLTDTPFRFSDDPGARPQSSEFMRLLEPDAPPVVQDFRLRDEGDRRVKYVGVGGVDTPHIIQVGAGERLVESIEQQFSVQNVVDKFADALQVSRIHVIAPDGEVIARSKAESLTTRPGREAAILALCRDFLQSGQEPYRVNRAADHISVVTRIYPREPDTSYALYLEYPLTVQSGLVSSIVTASSVLAVLMILLAVVLSVVLSRAFARPIEVLEAGARELGRGNLNYRVQLDTRDEFERLASAFNSMADSIHGYMRELESETKRRERLESELTIAAQMQRALLPAQAPEMPGVEVVGWSQPAREVGGDFYDYFDLGDGKLGIAIGDATGKGLSAAMLVTECWSAFNALAHDIHAPGELLRRTNNALCDQEAESGRFVTLFFMVIDPAARTVRYAVAGHNPPLRCDAHGAPPDLLSTREGFPLGIWRDGAYAEAEFTARPGDTLVLYSDGITEARDGEGALYGDDRLQKLVSGLCGRSAREILNVVREEVETHTGAAPIADDMTLVTVRFD
jgi:sigma-B regulation protein RsbU (phosphoserine phosphatase)